MRDQAIAIARSHPDPRDARNALREYLHHVILREGFEQGMLKGWVFHGGTALRLLHGLARFSEDLDFHLEAPDPDMKLDPHLPALQKGLELRGYSVSFNRPRATTVRSVFVRFGLLLHDAGLSLHADQMLGVKLEIDSNPPPGFGVEKSLVNAYFPIPLVHHDPPSFLAGKLCAVLQRSYVKGRDYYDLLFYLTRWKGLEPNFAYMNNALRQVGWKGPDAAADNWKALCRQRVESVDWSRVQSDMEPFFERLSDRETFQKEFLVSRLE